MSLATNSFQGLMLPTANSNVATQPVLNLVPLQTLPPRVAITYPQYTPYQSQTVASQKFPITSIPKESNESLLLNLTKKMEELAVNMQKRRRNNQRKSNFGPIFGAIIVRDRVIWYKIALHPLM